MGSKNDDKSADQIKVQVLHVIRSLDGTVEPLFEVHCIRSYLDKAEKVQK